MSAALLGLAFQAEAPSPTAKLILLKLVDCCRDDGKQIFPSKASVARAAQCTERHVQSILAEFCAVGLLRMVRPGGKGPGSTALYEMSIETLRRLADKGWKAVAGEAAGRQTHAPDAEQDVGEGDDAPESKVELSSPLDEARENPATAKGEPRFSQPLKETLKPEREDARERGQDPSPDGDAPDAGHAADAEDGGATLAEFRKLWPTTLADDNARVESAWAALPFEERRPAIDGIRPFLAGLKGLGRRNIPSGWTYLGQRKWRDVPAMAAEKQAQEFVEVAAWSRNWWAVLFHRLKIGQPCGFMLQQATDGKSPPRPAGELNQALAAYPDLPAFLCDGPEITAWRPWFEGKRLRIPDFSGRTFRVFLPAALPPGAASSGKREEGDDDVRL